MTSSNLSSLANVDVSVSAAVGDAAFRPAGPFGLPVVVLNEGHQSIRWSEPNALNLTYRWLGTEGELVERDGRRTNLPNGSLGPGERIELKLMGAAPEAPGPYTLVVSLVLEGVHWACDIGATGWVKVAVHVPPASSWPMLLNKTPGERALRGALLAAELGRTIDAAAFDAPQSVAPRDETGLAPRKSGSVPAGPTRVGPWIRARLNRLRRPV